MLNVVSLLAAAALASFCSFQVSAQIDSSNLVLENSIQRHPASPRKSLHNFVRIKPTPPRFVHYTPKTVLELECSVIGNPAPLVAWYKNGELIKDDQTPLSEILKPHSSSICQVISKLVLTAAKDGDVYTCVGNNGLVQSSASTTVYTQEINGLQALRGLPALPLKPIISTYYDFVFQDQGTSLVLPCRVKSLGDVKMYWMDPEQQVVYNNARLRVLPSGDLLVMDLDFDQDTGNYTCTAENVFGKVSVDTFVYPLKHVLNGLS